MKELNHEDLEDEVVFGDLEDLEDVVGEHREGVAQRAQLEQGQGNPQGGEGEGTQKSCQEK